MPEMYSSNVTFLQENNQFPPPKLKDAFDSECDMHILKMRAPQAKIFAFWNLTFQNGEIDVEWTDLPQRKYPPPQRTIPLNQKCFDFPQKHKISTHP